MVESKESKTNTSEKKLTAKERVAQEKGFFLIKSIRQYPDPYAFWRFEAISLTRKKTDKKRPLRFGGEDKKYTLRIDGYHKVKAEPLYDEDTEKGSFSKNKSMTAVSIDHKSCPPAFSFNGDEDWNSVEVGYMLPATPEYALIRRILRGAAGTIHRTYRYNTSQEARKAWELNLQYHTMFTTLGDLAQHGSKTQANEVMAHAKWGPEAKIAYFKNNLPSKLRAISLAYDMSRRLQQQQIEKEGDVKSPSDTKNTQKLSPVEICSYLPGWSHKTAEIKPYTQEQQEKDITKGLKSIFLKTRAFAHFIQLQKNGFVNKGERYSAAELEIFIKIAADLTYESSMLFFENFFLPNQKAIQDTLEQAGKLHILRDVFRCVPLEERSRLRPLLTTPKMWGYYVHSLLKFDFLEEDVEALFELLESENDIDFDAVGEYYQNNSLQRIAAVSDRNGNTLLHLAVAKNRIKLAKRLIQHNASVDTQNKDGKTPLYLAFELGHSEMREFLKEKKASHKYDRTPLHIAVSNNDLELVKKIISESKEKDKDINAPDGWLTTPLHLAAAKGNLKMTQYLLDNGARVNSEGWFGTPLQFSSSSLVKALLINKGGNSILKKSTFSNLVRSNNLIVVDLLLKLEPSLLSDMEDFRWNEYNLLYRAIRNKNDAMVDFLLTHYALPFPSLFYKDKTFGAIACIIIALGIGYLIYEFTSSQEIKKLVNDVLFKEKFWSGDQYSVGWYRDVIFCCLIAALCLFVLYQLNDYYEKYQVKKTIEDKVRECQENRDDSALKHLGLGDDLSIAGVVKHLNTLSLKEAADTLLKIAKVDSQFSLYAMIRLFNSNIEKASELLWQISQLQDQDRKIFIDLFKNPSADEQEVIVGCILERVAAEDISKAVDILNMFCSQTKEDLLKILDNHQDRSVLNPTIKPDADPILASSDSMGDQEEKKIKADDFPYPPSPSGENRNILFPRVQSITSESVSFGKEIVLQSLSPGSSVSDTI